MDDREWNRLHVHGVTAIEYACNARWRIPPRRIADDMFLAVLAGRGTATCDGRRSVFAPGDLLHWRRGSRHAASTDAGDPLHAIAIHYTAQIAGAIPLAELAGMPDRFALGPGHPLIALCREAAREYLHRPPGWQRGLEAQVTRLLLGLARDLPDQWPPTPASGPVRKAVARSRLHLLRLRPALMAMEDSLAAPLAMPALAARCGLSPAQFRRVFANALGCSPLAHLRRLRLAEACRLLREGGRGVAEVAAAVGYAEPAFFARSFRQAMGVSPGRYRDRDGW